MKKLFVLALLFLSSTILAEEPTLEKATASGKEYETFLHYGMHLAVTSAVDQIMLNIGQGVEAAITVLEQGTPPLVPHEQPAKARFFIARTFAYSAALLWVRYNLPQWTDTYFLGIDKQRTRKQNMIRFLHRMILGTPGALTGEYFARQFEAAA